MFELVRVNHFAGVAAIPISEPSCGELGSTLISPSSADTDTIRPSAGTDPSTVYNGFAVILSFASCVSASDTPATTTSATVMVASNTTNPLIFDPFRRSQASPRNVPRNGVSVSQLPVQAYTANCVFVPV